MNWLRRRRKKDANSFFKLRFGQILIFVIALFLTLGMVGISVYSSSPHQVEKLAILQESNDAASLAYSQRESFNLLLAMRDYKDGEIGIRELQIKRALLGQRLQVMLASNVQTYDIMSARYKAGLRTIDQWITQNSNTPVALRRNTYASNKAIIEDFQVQVRQMSKTIQQDSLRQVNKVVQERARSEFWQAAVLFLVIILGFVLLIWVYQDLRNGFRKSHETLLEERTKLESAQRRIRLASKLDELQSTILNRDISTWQPGQFTNELQQLVWNLYPDAGIKYVGIDHNGLAKLQISHPGAVLNDDLNLMRSRIAEIVEIHESAINIHNEAVYRANHDLVTGLLNRNGLARAFATNQKRGNAMLHMDIDRFRIINDSFGRDFGDRILKDIAYELNRYSDKANIARIGSDEFVIFFHADDEDLAREMALQIQSDLTKQIHHNGIDADLTLTAGLAYQDSKVDDFEKLIHEAEIAKTIAERQIRSGFAIYSENLGHEMTETLAEEHALRLAIARNELVLYMQPVVQIEEGVCAGGETLVRWNRPGHGIIYPDEFLPKIRDYGLTEEFTRWSLEAACRMRANGNVFMEQFGMTQWRVALNIEPDELAKDDFADILKSALSKYRITPNSFVLEITERALVESEVALKNIREIYEMGVRIAIDDFGTGFSNLSQIHNLPISVLKIDKSFLVELKESESAERVVRDIKRIADSLDLEVVAEGVEDSESEETIRALGINKAQGYYYSPALPEVEFWNWVRNFQFQNI